MAELGRPRAERRQRGVRMFEDTAEMLGWILRLEGVGQTAAEFLEECCRSEIERRYAPLAQRAEEIQRLEAGDDAPPVLANEMGGESGT